MSLNNSVKFVQTVRCISDHRSFQSKRFVVFERRRGQRGSSLIPPRSVLDSLQLNNAAEVSPIVFSVLSSCVTLLISRQIWNSKWTTKLADHAEWILIFSPTVFNQFVAGRCPSIFVGATESLDHSNERLVQEGQHSIESRNGRIAITDEDRKEEDVFDYQRVCITTGDGGVVSLDWPANLDLDTGSGLETTLLLIPGTPMGSLDEDVRSFVGEVMRSGIFPVVMNPRGCGGSPLTTARLFTAADSDDVSTAVEFVYKARSRPTMLAVGWGYGANMLTKYLAEVGPKTPFVAVACVNNLFDLEEVTDSPQYSNALDKKLMNGLPDILRSNKELFQGRAKGFDVEKALKANCVREFEKLISMVSYGFDRIEDFYSMCSSSHVIQNIKVPVLFIHSDDGTVPLHSVPRGLIAENPFTSLLLCSYESQRLCIDSALLWWCQKLAVEWLTAVEFSYLKGLHPLDCVYQNFLDDKDLAVVTTKRRKQTVEMHERDSENTLKELSWHFERDVIANLKLEEEYNDKSKSILQPIDSILVSEEPDQVEDAESGQLQQAALLVMNMLDRILPGILKEEAKQKVLVAVSEGETFAQALHDVVPAEAREKMTSSVNAILQKQQSNINVSKLWSLNKDSPVSEELKSKSDKSIEGYKVESLQMDNQILNEMVTTNVIDGNTDKIIDGSKMMEDPESQIQSDFSQQNSPDHLPTINNQMLGSTVLETKTESRMEMNEELHNAAEFTPPFSDGEDLVAGVKKTIQEMNDSSILQDENNSQLTKESNTSSQPKDKNITKDAKSSDGNSVSSGFNVVQALDSLTEMDDSTQVAVNSVFGVIEDIITRMEDEDSAHAKVNCSKDDGLNSLKSQTIENTNPYSGSSQIYEVKCPSEDIVDESAYDPALYRGNYSHGKRNDPNIHLDLDATTTLLLDYIPEEGQWKLLEDTTARNEVSRAAKKVQAEPHSLVHHQLTYITPWHYLPDDQQIYSEVCSNQISFNGKGDNFHGFVQFVEKVVSRALTVAIIRKVGFDVFKQMALGADIKHIATSVSFIMGKYKKDRINNIAVKDRVVEAMLTTYRETVYLKKLLPVAVVVGSSLAALGRYVNFKMVDDIDMDFSTGQELFRNNDTKTIKALKSPEIRKRSNVSENLSHKVDRSSSKSLEELKNSQKSEEPIVEDDQNNIVANLAEKAMLVAAPVVPTTEDGEVDQDRLVAMLADLGKKGGALRFVGKMALLWGGIRGAMSLTDKLISFLRIADRPLYQRIFGFFCMVLVLWSPFIVPFIPTLVQSWINNTPRTFAEIVCIGGLYTAIMVLVMLWGRRIRGYEDSLKQYGLDLSRLDLFKGLVCGAILILAMQASNSLLGFAHVYWPSRFPLSIDAINWQHVYRGVISILSKAIVSTGVVLVEELFFRSWLVEEIASELGYHRGVMISALAFTILQRSIAALPSFWLLSLALVGTRHRSGSLSIAIGWRIGMIASSSVLRTGSIFVYNGSFPLWLIGTDSLRPLDGIVSIPFAALLAIFLYVKPLLAKEPEE